MKKWVLLILLKIAALSRYFPSCAVVILLCSLGALVAMRLCDG